MPSLVSDSEWIKSRKADLPRGLRYTRRTGRHTGQYEFTLSKLFEKGMYKTIWPEHNKIEAIEEYTRMRAEVANKRKQKQREKEMKQRSDTLKREEVFLKNKRQRVLSPTTVPLVETQWPTTFFDSDLQTALSSSTYTSQTHTQSDT